MTLVPDIVHFIYPCENTRPLSFLNYMAVKSVFDNHDPDTILFWIDGTPAPSPWWDEIQSLVEINTFTPIKQYGGSDIVWPQYASDVFRLQVLHDYGGIYMDTDMIVLLPLLEFMKDKMVMSWEPTEPIGASACNALIISPPRNPFIKTWLEYLPEALKSSTWAEGGVNLPANISRWHQPLTKANAEIIDAHYFCPLDLKENWLFSTDPKIIREAEDRTRFSYAIHGFETYWRDIVKNITPEWCKQNDSLFSRIVNRS